MSSESVKLGQFELSIISDGRFWLDGGTMFGVVPKVMWNKLIPVDELNRVELSLNCLLIETPEGNVLIDTGIGDKLKDRFKEIYKMDRDITFVESLNRMGFKPENIDFVINTHLHFDHCGGNTIKKDGKLIPTFPNAKYIVQKQEWSDATDSNERTKASYLKENFMPVKESGQLMLVDGNYEVLPGIKMIMTNGHTKGHQSVLIESKGEKAIYLGDLIPTASHIKIPYIAAYDLFPLAVVEKKKEILEQAIKEKWLLIFEHDPDVVFAYVIEESGKAVLQPLHSTNPKLQNPIH
ncbi:MBL fold metallo-hydrolase [candidate division WOR-3 bacterium]|nr:MBL fold metallo-hydrolase [candidate division WOR-3 bacterium]